MTFEPTCLDQLPPVVLRCACGAKRVFPVGMHPGYALHAIPRPHTRAPFAPQMSELTWFDVEHSECEGAT